MGVIDKSKEILGGVKDAVVGSRRPRYVRSLGAKEREIAYSVFENSIPYSKVFITDGLGLDGRPFTLPDTDGRYRLHVGDGYYGMSHDRRPKDRALLIHELVHVWQGEHSFWRGTYVIKSGVSQVRHGNSAYDYDINNLKEWNSYNPEQQAEIVEGWYVDGMRKDDPRYRYIRFNIRGYRSIEIDLPPSKRITRVQSKAMEAPRRIPADILFGFDSARLKPEARSYLASVVDMLNTHAKGKTVIIEGHTDSVGSFAYNMNLSRARAQAVKKALSELGADNAANFKVKACGESKPLVPNTTAEGRQENRRVEFRYE